MKLTATQLDALIKGGQHQYQDVHAHRRTLWALFRLGLVRTPKMPYQHATHGWAGLTPTGKQFIIDHALGVARRLRGRDEPAMAATRDASWHDKPGRCARYHIITGRTVDGDAVTAACSPEGDDHWPRMVLDETSKQPASDVPEHMRCRRPGCRQRWPA